MIFMLLFASTHSSLQRTKSGRLDIRCLVGQPESRGHVHDEAERVPVLNLCHPHALDVPLGALLQLLLFGEESRESERDEAVARIRIFTDLVFINTRT